MMLGYIRAKIAQPTKPLADVNVLPQGDGSHKVKVCFEIDRSGFPNLNAVLAIDASASMKWLYGYGLEFNYMAAVVKKFGSILTEVSKSGKSIATYWGVGIDGSKIEEIGEFDKDDWSKASIQGPKIEKWGRGTKLLPAILYIVEDVALNSDLTIGVILTDGIIEDEEDYTDYCFKVGKKYVGKIPSPIKLVLIGIGENVDEEQLERFENMFEGTGIDYDLFTSCYVSDMQDEADILNCLFAQLIDPYTLIAPNGRVEDAKGNILINWNDGMPEKFEFILLKGDKQFTIKAFDMEIVQDVSEAIS